MEKYYTAIAYKNWERVGEPFSNDKGKLCIKVKQKCDRCTHGIYAVGVENGQIKPHPAYNGVCLKCDGIGFLTETVRLYTEKEFNAMEKAKERVAEKKEQEKRAKASEIKNMWLITNGFNPETNVTYVYIGEDSYARKDELKAAGWKYHQLVGWHHSEINIPYEANTIYTLDVDKAVEFNLYGNGVWKFSAQDFVKAAKDAFKKPSQSEWVGLEKDKVYDVPVVLKKVSGYQTRYGWSQVYTFMNGENVLVWFTSSNVKAEEGKSYLLTGTIKAHGEYKGEKQTTVTRVKLEEVK